MLILLVKNRPFPSCKNSDFLNEAKCKTFSNLVKMIFISMRIKTYFYIKSFTRSLALKQRLRATRKGPIIFWS